MARLLAVDCKRSFNVIQEEINQISIAIDKSQSLLNNSTYLRCKKLISIRPTLRDKPVEDEESEESIERKKEELEIIETLNRAIENANIAENELQVKGKFNKKKKSLSEIYTSKPIAKSKPTAKSTAIKKEHATTGKKVQPSEDKKRMKTSARVASSQRIKVSNGSTSTDKVLVINEKKENPVVSTAAVKPKKQNRKLLEYEVNEAKILQLDKTIITSKFRRQCHKFRQLQEEIKKTCEMADIETKENFISRLESTFDTPSSVAGFDDLQKLSKFCITKHKLFMEDVDHFVENIKEDEEMKIHSPFLSQAFQQFCADARDLHAESMEIIKDEKLLYTHCKCNNCNSALAVHNTVNDLLDSNDKHKDKVIPNQWLPLTKDTSDLLNQLRTSKGDETSNSGKYISYSTMAELSKLLDLYHEAQATYMQGKIEKEIATNTVPLIKCMDPNSKDFYELFRMVYSILCNGGKTLPTLVIDKD
ncbi:hypothetical protein TrispH2_002338 [Trichoplax sp. H2]|nr:hypothetical protein TrispH2_002338 [Trichoplax sp. H2]|eukprot:RDD45263.1 hypothetical protein TrispH2_002338 [Trichoplax sp. H2]